MAPGRVQPLNKPRIVKKRTKKFKRHQSDRKITVKVGYQLLVLHVSIVAHRDSIRLSFCSVTLPWLHRASPLQPTVLLCPSAGIMEEAKGYRLQGPQEVQGLWHHHAQHWVWQQQEDEALDAHRCAQRRLGWLCRLGLGPCQAEGVCMRCALDYAFLRRCICLLSTWCGAQKAGHALI